MRASAASKKICHGRQSNPFLMAIESIPPWHLRCLFSIDPGSEPWFGSVNPKHATNCPLASPQCSIAKLTSWLSRSIVRKEQSRLGKSNAWQTTLLGYSCRQGARFDSKIGLELKLRMPQPSGSVSRAGSLLAVAIMFFGYGFVMASSYSRVPGIRDQLGVPLPSLHSRWRFWRWRCCCYR